MIPADYVTTVRRDRKPNCGSITSRLPARYIRLLRPAGLDTAFGKGGWVTER